MLADLRIYQTLILDLKQTMSVMQQNMFGKFINEKQFQFVALSKSGILTNYEDQVSRQIVIQ